MDDILLQNGRLLDPVTGLDCLGDLAISQGKIRAVGHVERKEAVQTVDVTGCYVVPGLIDYHMHFFTSGCEFAVLPELPTI